MKHKGEKISPCNTPRSMLNGSDSIMYKKIKSQTDCQRLQCDLTKLESWEKTWGMCFHQELQHNRRFPRSMRSQGERPGCGSHVKRVDHGDAFNA